MTTRNIKKHLAGMQDLLAGVGEVSQTRGDITADVGSIDMPYAVLTVAEMQDLVVEIYTRARVYSSTLESIDYIYDSTATTGISSNVGAGYWVEVGTILTKTALYDFDVDGGAIGDITLATIPDNATVIQAWYEVLTAPTSAGSATIALGVETNDAAGIKAITAFDDASFALGYFDTLCDGTASTFTTKSTADRNIIMSIATAALTAGKLRLWFKYIRSE